MLNKKFKPFEIKNSFYVRYIAYSSNKVFSLAIAIPSVGFILSLFQYTTAFERSGALLVCFAIFNIYINHFVQIHQKSAAAIRDTIVNNRNTPSNTLRSLNLNPHITDKYVKNDINNFSRINKTAREDIAIFSKANKNIVHVEFISGLIGTLVWGFGGLLFTIKNCA